MSIPRQPTEQPTEPAGTNVPVPAEEDPQSKELDEALEESFPASDPVAIDITSIDPGSRAKSSPGGTKGR